MAKFTVKTGAEFANKIYALGKDAKTAIESALTGGAAVVKEEIGRGIQGLPEVTGVTKRGLETGLGISPVGERDGVYDVKVGFEGYNERGVPNAMMARIMESGTSKTPKHPFVEPARRRSAKAAVAAMQEAFDRECEKIMKG